MLLGMRGSLPSLRHMLEGLSVHLTAPWGRVVLEKCTVSKPVKKLLMF